MRKYSISRDFSNLRKQYQKANLHEEVIVLHGLQSIINKYDGLPNNFELDLNFQLKSLDSVLKVLTDLGIPHVRTIRLLPSFLISIVISTE